MNLTKIKKLLREIIVKSCNTEQISYLAREVDRNFNLNHLSGFGYHVVIPRQVAVDTVLDYFHTKNQILEFISILYQFENKGISGGIYQIKDKNKLEKLLLENDLEYNPDLKRIVVSQRSRKGSDWGFLTEGKEYKLAFSSIDIIGSSELIKTNVKLDIQNTLNNFRVFVNEIIESYDGRLWQWYGDGGLIVFLEEQGVSCAIRALCEVIYSLPIFNILKNELRWENCLSIRTSIHYGSAMYKKETNLIDSDDIEFTRKIEHQYGIPNSILISETAYNICDIELKKFFEKHLLIENLNLYRLKKL